MQNLSLSLSNFISNESIFISFNFNRPLSPIYGDAIHRRFIRGAALIPGKERIGEGIVNTKGVMYESIP